MLKIAPRFASWQLPAGYVNKRELEFVDGRDAALGGATWVGVAAPLAI
jgi:hypothetical protein